MQQVTYRTGACLLTHRPPQVGPCLHAAVASLVPVFVPALSHPFFPSMQTAADNRVGMAPHGPAPSAPRASYHTAAPKPGASRGTPALQALPDALRLVPISGSTHPPARVEARDHPTCSPGSPG